MFDVSHNKGFALVNNDDDGIINDDHDGVDFFWPACSGRASHPRPNLLLDDGAQKKTQRRIR